MIITHKNGDRVLRDLLRDVKYHKSNHIDIWLFRKKKKIFEIGKISGSPTLLV